MRERNASARVRHVVAQEFKLKQQRSDPVRRGESYVADIDLSAVYVVRATGKRVSVAETHQLHLRRATEEVR